jgi:hypothetical protein
MCQASLLLFNLLRLEPLSWLKPHYHSLSEARDTYMTQLPHHTNTKMPEGYAKLDVRHVQSRPDPVYARSCSA